MQTQINTPTFGSAETVTIPTWQEGLDRACKNLRVEPTLDALSNYTYSTTESILPITFLAGLLQFLEHYPLQSRIANSPKKVAEEIMQLFHSIKIINLDTIQIELRRNKLYKNIAHALNELMGKDIQEYLGVEEFATGGTNEAQLSRANTMIEAITRQATVEDIVPVELQ
jgi:hypothetical protein